MTAAHSWNSFLRDDDRETTERINVAVSRCRGILGRLQVIDARSYEPIAPTAAVQLIVPGALRQVMRCVDDAVELLEGLPALLDGEKVERYPRPAADLEVVSNDDAFEGEPIDFHDDFIESLEATLEQATAGHTEPLDAVALKNTCKTVAMQLRRCRDRVMEAKRSRSKWAMIAETEEARRKTHQALRVTVTLGAQRMAPFTAEVLFPEAPSAMRWALDARAVLLTFRCDMLEMAQAAMLMNDWELTVCMRDFRLRMLKLFGNPAYSHLRATDRYELQKLRRDISEWIDSSAEDLAAARNLLVMVVDLASQLAQVNERGLILSHDDVVVRRSCAELRELLEVDEPHGARWARFRRTLQGLDSIRWRSEELDHLVDRELERGMGAADTLVARVRGVMERLTAI